MTRITVKTVVELRKKLQAAKILTDNVSLYARGAFVSDTRDLIFFDMPRKLVGVGRVYAEAIVDGKPTKFLPDPNFRSHMFDNEFIIELEA